MKNTLNNKKKLLIKKYTTSQTYNNITNIKINNKLLTKKSTLHFKYQL